MSPLREFEQYTLLGEIAAGGMGVVYQAVHRGLNRSCALKLIRSGLLATPDERRRFVTEAEATAKLDHPNIVRVGRAAEFEGQWFLEMELVEGGTLADRVVEGPLPPKDAARLVESLARAAQHAHERGILHRDLKPANVLLAPDGQPKLTDFGLARFLEKDSDLTRTLDVLGTPAYLAPELASGRAREATTAADVYSLGVILFECLTGQRPFQGRTMLETLRAVQESAAPSPSALSPGLARDLEVITLRCLAREPERRFRSAGELADELGRFLRAEPIRSRPVPTGERLWLWCRRRPAVAALIAAVLLVTTLGVGGILIQSRRAELAAAQARRSLDTAVQAINDLSTVATEDRLQDPGIDDLRERLYGTIVPFLQEFVKLQPHDPTFQAKQAQAFQSLALLYQKTGRLKDAEVQFLGATALQSNLVAQFPNQPRYRRDLAATESQYSWLLSEAFRYSEAVAMAQNALKILEQVAKAFPESGHYREEFGNAYHFLGIALVRHANRPAEAERALNEAVRIRRELVAAAAASAASRNDLGIALLNLGNHISNQKRREETEALWTNAAAVFATLVAGAPGNPEYQARLAGTHDRLARLYADTARWPESEESFKKATNTLGNLVANYPRRPAYRHLLADANYQMGFRYSEAHRTNEAEQLLAAAIAQQNLLVSTHPGDAKYLGSLCGTYNRLADHYERTAQPAKAEQAYREELRVAERLAKERSDSEPDQDRVAAVRARLARLLMSQAARTAEAEEEMMRSITLREQRVAASRNPVQLQRDISDAYSELGAWHSDKKRFAQAEPMFQKAITTLKDLPKPERDSDSTQDALVRNLFNLAAALNNSGQTNQALEAFQKLGPLMEAAAPRHTNDPGFDKRRQRVRSEIQRPERPPAIP